MIPQPLNVAGNMQFTISGLLAVKFNKFSV